MSFKKFHHHLIPETIREEIGHILKENHDQHTFIKVGKRKWAKFDADNAAYWHVIFVDGTFDPTIQVLCHNANTLLGVMYNLYNDETLALIITDTHDDGFEESVWTYISDGPDGGTALYDVGRYAMD